MATIACEKEHIKLDAYFPLEEGTQWCYGSYFDGEALTQAEWKIEGDTTVDGKIYKQLTRFGEDFKGIREENGDFYKRKIGPFVNTTEAELLFLKTQDPDGASWEQIIGEQKYVFSQVVLPELLVHDKVWTDIIEVRIALFYKNLNGEFEPYIDWDTQEPAVARYDFANGKGLVSLHEPAAFNHFTDFAYSASNAMIIVECN